MHIESLAEALRGSTSPAGAALVAEEAEELRRGWQDLRQGLAGAQQDLHASLDTHSQYVARCQGLRGDIRRLRENMQELHHQLQDTREAGRAAQEEEEEQLLGHWRRYTVGLLVATVWWTQLQITWMVHLDMWVYKYTYSCAYMNCVRVSTRDANDQLIDESLSTSLIKFILFFFFFLKKHFFPQNQDLKKKN